MSATALDIVRAAVDAAMLSLDKHGLNSHLPELPRLFERAVAERNKVVRAVLTTKSGKEDELAKTLLPLLEERFNKPVDLQQAADPSIIGGAILTIDDERLDLSVRGTLDQLRQSISSH